MKRGTSFLVIGFVVAVSVALALAESRRERVTREFMRDKLELAKGVLEGVTTADYDLIVAKASKLSAMSQAADWRVFENPDYDRFSVEFRRQADALANAGRMHNLDAATLAYVRMTLSCVECHKFVRGKKIASVENITPSGEQLTARTVAH